MRSISCSTALRLGYDAIGIADRNTLAGVVRLHVEATTARLTPVIGCRLVTIEGHELPRLSDATARPMDDCRRCCRRPRWRPPTALGRPRTAATSRSTCSPSMPEGIAADLAAARRSRCRWRRRGDARGPRRAPADACAMSPRRYLYRGDDVARINRLDAMARRTACRSSPPTTSITTRPNAARCRTS